MGEVLEEKREGTLEHTWLGTILTKVFNFGSKREFTNPYSQNLDYFFTEVARNDHRQLTLMKDYAKYETLRQWIHMVEDKNGNVLKFEAEEDKYSEAKKKLIAERKYNP